MDSNTSDPGTNSAPGDTQETQELQDRIVAYLDAHPTVGMPALARSLTGMGITVSSRRISRIWGAYHPGATRQHEEDELAACLARDDSQKVAPFRREFQDHQAYVELHGEGPKNSPREMCLITQRIREDRGITNLPPLTEEQRAAAWAAWEEECSGPLDPEREAAWAAWNHAVVTAWAASGDLHDC
jgi:hypothetical protein